MTSTHPHRMYLPRLHIHEHKRQPDGSMNVILRKCVDHNANLPTYLLHKFMSLIKLTHLCWDISQTTFLNAFLQWQSLRQLKLELKVYIRNYPSFGSEGLDAKQAFSPGNDSYKHCEKLQLFPTKRWRQLIHQVFQRRKGCSGEHGKCVVL